MPKLKGPQDLPNKSTPSVSKPDPWNGPWGRINPTPQSVQTLRLCKGVASSEEESFSYPYRNLSSWIWRRKHDQEELKIEAGPDAILLLGEGLSRLVDALDTGALEVVREGSGADASSLDIAIRVKSLVIEKSGQLSSHA